jgi:hypothetical protein
MWASVAFCASPDEASAMNPVRLVTPRLLRCAITISRLGAMFALSLCGLVATAQTPAPPPVPARTAARPQTAAARPTAPVAKPVARSAATSGRPAVLILSVDEAPVASPDAGRIRVVAPWNAGELPVDVRQRIASAGRVPGAVPVLPSNYELVRTYHPDPQRPDLNHYVYLDLNDPFAARRWREFQQAQRAEERLARGEAENEEQWRQRKALLLQANRVAVVEGIEQMRAGDYRGAAIALTRAADLDQGDPLSRLYLAQARVALGHDTAAGDVLRRALELQPRMVPMRLDLQASYPAAGELERQVDALANRIMSKQRATPNEYVLLGFMEFQRGHYDAANAAFKHAARIRPRDPLIKSFLELSAPARP